jgi:NADH dehydrogenase FAD-containing subunit
MATSFEVPNLAEASGLPVDATSRLLVDETLRCPADLHILGAGDAVAPPSSVAAHLRMGCASALPLGGHAANTLLAMFRGGEAPPFSMGYAIQCLSLGRHNGYIQLVRADDTPRNFYVSGRAGARVKEMISTMVIQRPRQERVNPGSYAWPRGPRTPRRAITRVTSVQASPDIGT